MSDTPLTDAAMKRVDVAYVGYDGLSSSPEEYVSPDFARTLERELTLVREALNEADADCAAHNRYTEDESARAVVAIRAAEGWDDKTYASWHDRIWWMEQMREIARLRAALTATKTVLEAQRISHSSAHDHYVLMASRLLDEHINPALSS